MNVIIVTMPLIGHVNPLRPIARELVERGHHVRWWTGLAFGSVVRGTGAQFVPMSDAVAPPGLDALDEAYPERGELSGMDKLRWDIEHVFLDPIPAQVVELRGLLADRPADVVVADAGLMGAAALHELDGTAWVSVGVIPLAVPSWDTAPFGTARPPARSAFERLTNRVLYLLQDQVVLRGVGAHRNRIRAELGLSPTGAPVMATGFSPLLHLQGGVPELEYPRGDLPAQVHFVGALAEPIAELPTPPWWPEVAESERPIVHVSQGTISDTNLDDLVLPTLRALADLDVWVLATIGRHDPAGRGPLPANARAAGMLPYQLLLPGVR